MFANYFLDLLDSPFYVLSEQTTIPYDQIKLLSVLIICIPLGLLHKYVRGHNLRNLYSFLLGAMFQIFLFRSEIFLTLFNSIFLYIVMFLVPKKLCGNIIFLLSMITLSFVHIKRMIVKKKHYIYLIFIFY